MACTETTSTLIESVVQWKSQAKHKTQQEQQNMDSGFVQHQNEPVPTW